MAEISEKERAEPGIFWDIRNIASRENIIVCGQTKPQAMYYFQCV